MFSHLCSGVVCLGMRVGPENAMHSGGEYRSTAGEDIRNWVIGESGLEDHDETKP